MLLSCKLAICSACRGAIFSVAAARRVLDSRAASDDPPPYTACL